MGILSLFLAMEHPSVHLTTGVYEAVPLHKKQKLVELKDVLPAGERRRLYCSSELWMNA